VIPTVAGSLSRYLSRSSSELRREWWQIVENVVGV